MTELEVLSVDLQNLQRLKNHLEGFYNLADDKILPIPQETIFRFIDCVSPYYPTFYLDELLLQVQSLENHECYHYMNSITKNHIESLSSYFRSLERRFDYEGY